MTLTLQILCDGVPCGPPLSESAARAWLAFVSRVPMQTVTAMVAAMRPIPDGAFTGGNRADGT